METQNFDETILAFRSRVPFRPFTVALVNGHRYEVDHSGSLVIRDGVAVYLAPGGVPVIFDHGGVSEIVGDLMGESIS